MRYILPSITTHSHTASSWRDKIREVEQLRLSRVALFLTGLSHDERRECFALLERVQQHQQLTIPFVHAVADMSDAEYRYLTAQFETQSFNLHPVSSFPLQHRLSRAVRRRIFIENADFFTPLTSLDIEGFAGICLDMSHLEEARRVCPEAAEQVEELLEQFPVGANHLSAVVETPILRPDGRRGYSRHVAESAADLAYLANYPTAYYSPYCALELENSIAEQLTFLPRVTQHIAAHTQAVQARRESLRLVATSTHLG